MRRDDHAALALAARQEASELVKIISDRQVGETVKVAIAKAASRLGLSYSRTEDIWRLEARRIDGWELDLLRRAAKIRRKKSRA